MEQETQSKYNFLRRGISSNLDELAYYHTLYPWIPSPENIRPSPEKIQEKNLCIAEIQEKYRSNRDFILAKIFQKPIQYASDGKYMVDEDLHPVCERDIKFIPSNFAYKMPMPCTNHFILWYHTHKNPYENVDDEEERRKMISKDIEERLVKLYLPKGSSYDFVWYENPKMSLPEFYHVQVFWVIIPSDLEATTE